MLRLWWVCGVVLDPCFNFCLWKCGSKKVIMARPLNSQGFCLLFCGVVLDPCFNICLWKCGSEKVIIARPLNSQGFYLLFFLEEIPLHPPERKRWQRGLSTSSNALSHLTRHLKHTTDPLYSGCDHIQTQHINETSKSPEMTHSSTFIVSLLLHV